MKIALTGGIACGKSAVQQILEQQGVPVIDADQVTHQLYANDPELKALIKEHFTDEVFNADGSINRGVLGNKVFGKPEKLQLLSSWIHPKVRETIKRFFQQAVDLPEQIAVAVIPILFESGQEDQYDEVWVVKATFEQQFARLVENRGLNDAEAAARIGSQIPIEEKVSKADVVIDNTGNLAETEKQIEMLLKNYQWLKTN